MNTKTEGIPLQGTNEYRERSEYWPKPSPFLDKQYEEAAQRIAYLVTNQIRRSFGDVQVNWFLENYPEFSKDIEASIVEAYREGNYDGWSAEFTVQNDKSAAQTGRVISAVLESALKDEGELETKTRVLYTFAGLDAPQEKPKSTKKRAAK